MSVVENEDTIGGGEEEEEDFANIDYSLDDEPAESEEIIKEEPKKEEEVKNSLLVDEDEVARLKADLQIAQQEVEKERAAATEAYEEFEKIRVSSIQGQMNQWKNDLSFYQRQASDLQVEFEKAKINQDTDEIAKIYRLYQEKQDILNQINSNLTEGQRKLDDRPVRKIAEVKQEEKPKKTAGELMAEKWASENPWYGDPTHKVKRDLVDKLCADAIAAKYDPSSLKFWNYIDRNVEASEKKESERRTRPAMRPVSNQGGTQSVSNNKKKADPEILRAAHAALSRRNITKGHPDFEEKEKSYYATFSREINKSRESNG